jgi:polyhydroxyalkanoate synthesis repressor PhaR
MSRQDRFLRSNAQQKERAWERRRIYFAAASTETRQDGEFRNRNEPRRNPLFCSAPFFAAHKRGVYHRHHPVPVPAEVHLLKKYPNRRLYDTEKSTYVTLDDVRQMILAKESVKVVESKTEKDITRSVLLQIIAEQEIEGHEPLLTNGVLQHLIRFYGQPMQGFLGRYLEQSVVTFLDQQRLYQRRLQQLMERSPLKLMQQLADQNLSFWRSMIQAENAQAPTSSAEEATRESPSEPSASNDA